jgi:hypothetical protein
VAQRRKAFVISFVYIFLWEVIFYHGKKEKKKQFYLDVDEIKKTKSEKRGSIICTDKKENQIFLLYEEIRNGAVAKAYMTNGLLIYDLIFAHFLIYDFATTPFLILILFFINVASLAGGGV